MRFLLRKAPTSRVTECLVIGGLSFLTRVVYRRRVLSKHLTFVLTKIKLGSPLQTLSHSEYEVLSSIRYTDLSKDIDFHTKVITYLL